MNGICKVLDCHYGAIATDDCGTEWLAIKVYRDGNEHIIGGPFATEDEAEEFAGQQHTEDLAANSQFGVGA